MCSAASSVKFDCRFVRVDKYFETMLVVVLITEMSDSSMEGSVAFAFILSS